MRQLQIVWRASKRNALDRAAFLNLTGKGAPQPNGVGPASEKSWPYHYDLLSTTRSRGALKVDDAAEADKIGVFQAADRCWNA